MSDNVVKLPIIPRPHPPHVSLLDKLRKSREESKANVQAMTDQFVAEQRQREKEAELEAIRKHQRQLFFCQLRTMVRLGGKKWTMEVLDEGKEAVEFMPAWLAE